ncbi:MULTISPECIES: DUF6776 family protein [unclassified Shewanella]|uniref:DUF6776 family protein n=1 Tax=unclassified Shewanella TaxID=196818 RepID=UPI001BBBF6EC|nr:MULTISPECIES: DUF6776 family protein [unclassified Shewanella]GIU21415.1 hypothetical protein TUM4444_40790 [Shewanella sp. MBTL60-112-B1]GIU33448.1 hypothetical protein TUM4445_20560 [Shewanella sp. MBTL60-112-B2]
MPNYHRWIDRMQVIERQIRPSSVYLLLLLLIAFTLGALIYDVAKARYLPKVEAKVDNSERYVQELQQQAQTLAARNIELALEREANRDMQAMFVEQNVKQKELERELAFYRSVMAPENNADGVAINTLELEPSLEPRQYRVKLVLTQLEKRKRSLAGRSEITLVGLQDGKTVSLKLSELSDASFKFKFRYFQVLEGEFTLPEGFSLSRVKAKVIVPTSRWTKGSQTEQEYSAQDLLVDEKEQGILLEQNTQVLDNSAQQTEVRGNND